MKHMRYFTAATLAALTTFSLVGTASAQTLKTQKFPDGSGQMGVAPNWRMDAAQGGANLTGPNGAGMWLGMTLFVLPYNFDKTSLTPGVNPEIPRAHFDDPVKAFLDVMANAQQRGLLSHVKLKGIEPVAGAAGKTALIRYSCQMQGTTIDVFGLYTILSADPTNGRFYFSAVYGPTAEFNKRLPEMMAMWQSWSMSPKEIQSRLSAAQKTLGEIDMPGKLDAINQNKRAAAERMAKEFQGYIRQ